MKKIIIEHQMFGIFLENSKSTHYMEYLYVLGKTYVRGRIEGNSCI